MYKRLFLNKKMRSSYINKEMRSSYINNKIGCIDEEEYEDNNSLRVDINEKIYYSCIRCNYIVISPYNKCIHNYCDYCLTKYKICKLCN